MSSVLITGTSSGIGNAAAHRFAKEGWTVFAGSRNPEPKDYHHENIHPITIDVNDNASIAACFAKLNTDKVTLDCVVNNAGWGLCLPFEDTEGKKIEDMYRTNVLGLMEVTRHACTMMREAGKGTIINIASIGGRISLPFYSVYCSTKFAVEGFSEGLWHEMEQFGVRVKMIEPGGVSTNFHKISYEDQLAGKISEPYKELVAKRRKAHEGSKGGYEGPEQVADVIYTAATDGSKKLRYPATSDARFGLRVRKLLPDWLFLKNLQKKYFHS